MISQVKPHQPTTDLQQVDYQKAIQQRNKSSNRYYKGQQVSIFPSLPHFKMYGVGMYLFFSFLKHIAIVFLILTIISIAPIALNIAKGNTFKNSQNSLNIILTRTSIGSHKYSIMKVSDAYSQSITYKVVNVVFDILSCLVYLIFCLYWQKKSKNIEKHISREIQLQSSLTVQVVEFPECREADMEVFMGRFGTVTEVVAARDYTSQINLSKSIYQKQLQLKQLQLQNKQTNSQQITNLTQQIKQLYQELSTTSTRSHQIIKYYVQYSNSQTQKQVLTKFQPYQRACRCRCFTPTPQELLLKQDQVKVIKCNTEPIGILWENAHVRWQDRVPRYILQLFIVLGILVGGFFFISFLNILIPPIDTDIDTSNYSFQMIKQSNQTGIVQAWCIQNYVFNGVTSPYYTTCQSSWRMYTNGNIISVSISVIVMILCAVIKKIVYALGQFQRYGTRAEQSVTIMTNLFIMEFLTTTLITFLMQANVFSLSIMALYFRLTTSNDIKNNIISMGEYSDLTPNWYRDIGYQLWFNIFIMIFLPQVLQPLAYFLRQKLSEYRAKKQKIHRKAKQILELPQFQIEDIYANMLVVISTAFIFGGGIQLMMIVVFFCFFVRYWYYKFMFVRFCKAPLQFNEILNDRVILILKIVLILRFMISLYMYGANDIFAMEKSTFMQWASSLGTPVFSSIFIILSRIALTWYYTIFAVLFILILIFKQLVYRGVKKFKQWRRSKGQQNSSAINPAANTTQGQMRQSPNSAQKNKQLNIESQQNSIQSWQSNQNQQIMSQRQVLKSYHIDKNPLYQSILTIMKPKLRRTSTKDIVQEMDGTELQNNTYIKNNKR